MKPSFKLHDCSTYDSNEELTQVAEKIFACYMEYIHAEKVIAIFSTSPS